MPASAGIVRANTRSALDGIMRNRHGTPRGLQASAGRAFAGRPDNFIPLAQAAQAARVVPVAAALHRRPAAKYISYSSYESFLWFI
jgi:hypothetical protein